jgi:uncharacterized protein YcbK (DUF882 family)
MVSAVGAAAVVSPEGRDPLPGLPRSARAADRIERKGTSAGSSGPLRATLVDTHSPARLAIDDLEPTAARFDALLADPVLGGVHPIDPTLLEVVRELAASHPLARIEVVSGFRSPRLNEALRKKGHHVASHSQHTLGHALDLRVVPDGSSIPMDPRALAAEIRALGWKGGVGIYLDDSDRFVHADVGPTRGWNGQ